MKIVLLSTYELGHQPFGLASPAAWLKAAGHEVACADLSIEALPERVIREADLVAFYLPMHTATRLAVPVIARVKALNPAAKLCGFGLYAPLNEQYLRGIGVDFLLGGEFESALTALAGGNPPADFVSLDRLSFRVPDRGDLPALSRYAQLRIGGDSRIAGYTEASRGCKHLCRHCPVVPVYQGTFRIVQAEIVLADIRAQVAAGARHITFGDPDFFNGPAHAARIIDALHREFPDVTYDATIKVEHLLARKDLLPLLKNTGCLFVTSAVESVDDAVLEKLDKGHTRRDFFKTTALFRESGLTLSPTFIPFTPWTTEEGYRDLLRVIADLDLIENVSPVQLALRLLIPASSRMLELPEIQGRIDGFDRAALVYRWRHEDPAMDALASRLLKLIAAEQKNESSRRTIFREIWNLVHEPPMPEESGLLPRAAIPYLNEPWYC